MGQRRMRDQQRQWFAHCTLEVVVGVDRDEAIDLHGSGDIDVGDPRVGMRTAYERDPERVMPEVVEISPSPTHQPRVLDSRDPLAEHLGGHDVGLAFAAQLCGPQHRSDDVLVARAAAQVAADRLPGLVLGRVGDLVSR